jgi:hypothetical protein
MPLSNKCQEMFSNYNSNNGYNLNNAGILPISETLPLLYDSYPLTGNKNVSNKNYGDIWWLYPIFPEPSFKQITNNLQYFHLERSIGHIGLLNGTKLKAGRDLVDIELQSQTL